MTYEQENCPFCQIAAINNHHRVLQNNDHGFVIRDGFPVTEGHSLIIPRRHVLSFFELTKAERNDLLDLLDAAKADLNREYGPAAYNIGINDGPAAGQTIPHVHIHLIPRFNEAGVDPRGGVRWIVPEKADYWSGCK